MRGELKFMYDPPHPPPRTSSAIQESLKEILILQYFIDFKKTSLVNADFDLKGKKRDDLSVV